MKNKTRTPDWNFMLVLPVFTLCTVIGWKSNLGLCLGSPDKLIAATRIRFSSLLSAALPLFGLTFTDHLLKKRRLVDG